MITMANGFTASEEYKRQLNDLTMEVFELNFDRWMDRGLWDDDFECYSIIEDGVMLANISVYRMNLLINGKPRNYIQVSTVATREKYRGRGLSRQLMEHIFSLYPETPAFLIGGDSVVDFYPKFGFVPVVDRQPYIKCRLCKGPDLRRLDIDDPKIDMYMKGRTQYSNIFDCINRYSINWFHMLYRYPKRIYEVPELGAMFIALQYENELYMLDVAATKPISFSELMPYLSFEGVDTVSFCFNPDWLGLDYMTREHRVEDSNLFIKGDFGVEGEFIVPNLIWA